MQKLAAETRNNRFLVFRNCDRCTEIFWWWCFEKWYSRKESISILFGVAAPEIFWSHSAEKNIVEISNVFQF